MSDYGWVDLGNGRSVYRKLERAPRGERSDLPAPMLSLDTMDALWHPSTGELVDSKSHFRAITKSVGGTEVGNETQTPQPFVDTTISSDVGQAVQMLKQGYKPGVSETASEGWS